MKSFTKLIAMMIVVAGVAASGGMFITDSEAEAANPSLFRSTELDGADAPSGRLVLRVPAATKDEDVENPPVPTVERDDPPVEPLPSDDDTADNTFFGECLEGNVVLVLDMSHSMHVQDVGSGEDYDGNAVANVSREDCVKFEAVRVLRDMSENDSIDFVVMNGYERCLPAYTGSAVFCEQWKGALTPIADSIREEAISYVRSLALEEGTPTWRSLEIATNRYGVNIDKLIFLSDGAPQPVRNGGWKNSYAVTQKEAIAADFPTWFAPIKANGCELVCIQIGNNASAGDFMREFAAQNGARYVHR